MLRNYLKTALRNLWKNKTYSFLNIMGLSVGITCAALIFLWVEDEVNYDHHHKGMDQIGLVLEHQVYEGKTVTFGSSPGPLAQAMQNEVSGIKYTARTSWGNRVLFALGDKSIFEQGLFMDSSFFKIFNFPFIKGNPEKPFSQLHSMAISESMAEKFFGSVNNAYGQTLKMDHEQEYVISGVFKNIPVNSSIKFEWAIPYKIYEDRNTFLTSWDNNSIQTYARLEENADMNQVNRQLSGLIVSKKPDANAKAFLFPIKDWRLRSKWVDGQQVGGRIQYVRLFTTIAWIILIIACINFMNLATARSEQRAREVGVRKVLGAGKKSLISQFLGESILMAFVSVLLAVAFIYLVLPSFNSMVDKQLSPDITKPLHLTVLLGIGLVCGLVAGSYPSLYLSSFNPTTVFKGLKIQGNNSASLIRKGLVVAQFAISIILIIGTIIIYQQVDHVKGRQLGYDRNNLIYMGSQGKINQHFPAIYQDLLATGQVENAAMANGRLLQLGNNSSDFSWQGKDPNAQILITMEYASQQYINTMGMKLKSGRQFGPVAENDSNHIIINESLAKLFKKDNVIGEIIKANNTNLEVIGVVNDFVYSDMYASPAPLILYHRPMWTNNMFIRFRQGASMEQALAKVETVLKKHNPGYPFEYKFLDEEFGKLFKSEMLVGKLSRIFAFLAIFISCLGLFGLAAYTAERRTREIGIRKVLGASVSGITRLLSMDFLKLVVISLLIAFPLAWYYMSRWLQDFAYRIQISWVVFLAAGMIAIFIAVFTISFQAIRAAVANPVKSLRSE